VVADEARLSARRPGQGQDLSVLARPARDMGQRPSDNELVRRVGDADGAALAELYQRFGRQCYALARRVCVDGRWAQDVVQEVFLTLRRDPSRFDPSRGCSRRGCSR
jgi:RNA polymerase sigma-70 factor (ECF subfamily)